MEESSEHIGRGLAVLIHEQYMTETFAPGLLDPNILARRDAEIFPKPDQLDMGVPKTEIRAEKACRRIVHHINLIDLVREHFNQSEERGRVWIKDDDNGRRIEVCLCHGVTENSLAVRQLRLTAFKCKLPSLETLS